MKDRVAVRLVDFVADRGDDWVDDPSRCRGVLHDLFPDDRAETAVLLAAVEEGVPQALRTAGATTASHATLVARLVQDRALRCDAADWAVRTWSTALGVAASDTPAGLPSRDEPATRDPATDEPVSDRPVTEGSDGPAQRRRWRPSRRLLAAVGGAVLLVVVAVVVVTQLQRAAEERRAQEALDELEPLAPAWATDCQGNEDRITCRGDLGPGWTILSIEKEAQILPADLQHARSGIWDCDLSIGYGLAGFAMAVPAAGGALAQEGARDHGSCEARSRFYDLRYVEEDRTLLLRMLTSSTESGAATTDLIVERWLDAIEAVENGARS